MSSFWSALDLLPDYLSQHVILSATALLFGVLIGGPLAIVCAQHVRWRGPLLLAASLIQTIPGLALLALFYPLLLALSNVLKPAIGLSLPALGFLPAVLALTLYAVLPILRNGVTGLLSVDPAVIEAAKGVGMTRGQMFWQVELPLAAPVFMAGIRTSAVWTIGAATLATPVGQTSLGNYIFSGLQLENWLYVLFGCAASAGLALLTDICLGLTEAGLAQRRPMQTGLGLAIICIGVACAAGTVVAARHQSGTGVADKPYVIGAKNFAEQFILAEVIADRLKQAGAKTTMRDGLGSAIAFRALSANDIDVYVDYSGTLWANVLERTDHPPRAEMLSQLGAALKSRFGVRLLGTLGFENAYGLMMKKTRAKALGITSLQDLAAHASELALGSDLEFLHRPEWESLRTGYGLNFRRLVSYDPTFMYRALAQDDVDVISGFTSDGRIAANDLIVLADPRGALPLYDALMLVAPRRAGDAILEHALRPLIDRIHADAMRQANLLVDRDEEKNTPREAAQGIIDLLKRP